MGRIFALPEMRDKLGNQGADVRTNSPDEFADFFRTEKDRWAKVVKEADVKVE